MEEYWSDELSCFVTFNEKIPDRFEEMFGTIKKKFSENLKPIFTVILIILCHTSPVLAYDKKKFATLSTIQQVDRRDEDKKIQVKQVKARGKGRRFSEKSSARKIYDQELALEVESRIQQQKNKKANIRPPLIINGNYSEVQLIEIKDIFEKTNFEFLQNSKNFKTEMDLFFILTLILLESVKKERKKMFDLKGGGIPEDSIKTTINKLLDVLPFGVKQSAKFIVNKFLDMVLTGKSDKNQGGKSTEAMIMLASAAILRYFWEDIKQMGFLKKKNRNKLKKWLEENYEILLLSFLILITKNVWMPILFPKTSKENEKTNPVFFLGNSLKDTVEKLSDNSKLDKHEKAALNKQLYSIFESERKKSEEIIKLYESKLNTCQTQRENFLISNKDVDKQNALLQKDLSYIREMINTCKYNYQEIKSELQKLEPSSRPEQKFIPQN